jgi:hypothetical protein
LRRDRYWLGLPWEAFPYVDGIISNQHFKCTITLVEIMDSQILVLHVKFSKIKPHLVVATNMNNTSEKNDNTTTCTI